MNENAHAHFVESIPIGMEDLAGTPGVESTADALIRLTNAAACSIDFTAMYWALHPDPTSIDEQGWSVDRLKTEFGAARGVALFDALSDAATRGVKIRIISSPGFDKTKTEDEADRLRKQHPDQIQLHRINMADWYGSGIMHQKIWVFDGRAVYIGSANMDWKSLTQVKEIGLAIENAPEVAADVSQYFETWWKLSGLVASDTNTTTVADPTFLISRKVPVWSALVPTAKPRDNPLDVAAARTTHSWATPLEVSFGDERGTVALSGAPREVCVGARTFDQDMLVNTILSAERSVCICVMDFAPVSLYRGEWSSHDQNYIVDGKTATPVWWPALIDALLHVVSTTGVHGRLLVSEWAHTSQFIGPYLDALAATARAALANTEMTAGKLEIGRFRVPGWESTGAIEKDVTPQYPGHTRVNHTKYIVTDSHINIGTSNMTWDYFNGTAGASFNATHPSLVQKLQEIFDRDWDSEYVAPIPDLGASSTD